MFASYVAPNQAANEAEYALDAVFPNWREHCEQAPANLQVLCDTQAFVNQPFPFRLSQTQTQTTASLFSAQSFVHVDPSVHVYVCEIADPKAHRSSVNPDCPPLARLGGATLDPRFPFTVMLFDGQEELVEGLTFSRLSKPTCFVIVALAVQDSHITAIGCSSRIKVKHNKTLKYQKTKKGSDSERKAQDSLATLPRVGQTTVFRLANMGVTNLGEFAKLDEEIVTILHKSLFPKHSKMTLSKWLDLWKGVKRALANTPRCATIDQMTTTGSTWNASSTDTTTSDTDTTTDTTTSTTTTISTSDSDASSDVDQFFSDHCLSDSESCVMPSLTSELEPVIW